MRHRPLRLIVCINQRLGIGQRSCVDSGNLVLIARIEAMIADAGLDVPIVRRECLGRCEEGPVMRIAPGGAFYTELNDAKLERILQDLKVLIANAQNHAD